MVNKKNLYGIPALALVFGMALAGCNYNGRGSDGGDRTEITNEFYGVTNDGKSIELILSSSNKIAQNARAIEGRGTYVIKIGGSVASNGSFTDNDGTLMFTPTDKNIQNVTISGGGLTITVTETGGTTYSGKLVELEDYFYLYLNTTVLTESAINNKFKNKTIQQIFDYIKDHTTEFGNGEFSETEKLSELFGNNDSILRQIASGFKNNVVWTWFFGKDMMSGGTETGSGEIIIEWTEDGIVIVSRLPFEYYGVQTGTDE
jgi:small nuclear ribonucleoprotein (snRNP)-like protein